MIDRAALTRNILIAMVAGLVLGSIVHAAGGRQPAFSLWRQRYY